MQQQNEFIEQNENELQQKNEAEGEIQKLKRKINEISNQNNVELQEKSENIQKLTEQLDFKRYL